MTIRTHWLLAIKNAKDAGLNGLAFALIALHDRAFPSDRLKPLYDRLTLQRFQAQRHLEELAPADEVFSYPKLDGTIRERPILYRRRSDGRIARVYPTQLWCLRDIPEGETFDEFCNRKDQEQAEEDEQREVWASHAADVKAWRKS